LTYILLLTVWVYIHSHFSGGLRKTIFYEIMRFGRSRSSKVIDFGTNRKRIMRLYFFMVTLVLSCTISEMLQVLCSWPLFNPNFGVFPLDQIAHDGLSRSRNLKLISREIILEVFQPMWSRADRRTDARTDDMLCHNRALYSILR